MVTTVIDHDDLTPTLRALAAAVEPSRIDQVTMRWGRASRAMIRQRAARFSSRYTRRAAASFRVTRIPDGVDLANYSQVAAALDQGGEVRSTKGKMLRVPVDGRNGRGARLSARMINGQRRGVLQDESGNVVAILVPSVIISAQPYMPSIADFSAAGELLLTQHLQEALG